MALHCMVAVLRRTESLAEDMRGDPLRNAARGSFGSVDSLSRMVIATIFNVFKLTGEI
jgi:hypothetical protein